MARTQQADCISISVLRGRREDNSDKRDASWTQVEATAAAQAPTGGQS